MFYEFLPLEPASATPRGSSKGELASGTLLPHELCIGEQYELVITNLGGLCRYRIGDVIRVVGFHHGAPLVEFQYRQGQLLNLRGEKTSEPQLAAAVSKLWPAEAGALVEYSSAERAEAEVPHYLIFLELVDGSRLTPEMGPALDRALRESNPVYDSWRRKGALGPCQVRQVEKGGFERLRAERLIEGASPQQLKVSRVLRNAAHVDLLWNWKGEQ